MHSEFATSKFIALHYSLITWEALYDSYAHQNSEQREG